MIMKAGAGMGEIRDNLKKNLGYYLSLRGISQKELAKRLNISQAAITNWIKGKNSPDIETVALICDILDISVTALFGTDEHSQYTDQEKRLIKEYHNRPELQNAINILLGLEKKGDT